MIPIEQVSSAVLREVMRAQQQWGTEFDEKNTLNDWAAYTNIYLSKATAMNAPKEVVVANLRKAAGLLLSALFYVANDKLAPRHYDGQPRPQSLPDIRDTVTGG